MSRTTHTYAILPVSPQTYHEIRAKLFAAGYQGTFHTDDEGEVIDMHGIAIQAEAEPTKLPCPGCGSMYVRGRGLSVPRALAAPVAARMVGEPGEGEQRDGGVLGS